jgi:hypothetical protein
MLAERHKLRGQAFAVNTLPTIAEKSVGQRTQKKQNFPAIPSFGEKSVKALRTALILPYGRPSSAEAEQLLGRWSLAQQMPQLRSTHGPAQKEKMEPFLKPKTMPPFS